ncbi:hypothetical protein [Streptomyces sp. NBC_00582]|uniref:hypothetical protein n=1 Tax=Streptomyces sp. NBC_00582 TaxID=2975783 RepID=UPI002E80BA96|nr:hypothetical protein [Streptomyces sp. NBC_00582]WUB59712.1 hypothetical protein OG852_04540 [Streptomyces sp. NBC_00582]
MKLGGGNPFRPRRRTAAARTEPVRPTYRRRAALADELTELAEHPRLAPHSGALRELADAVRRDRDLEVWAGGSLVAAYGGPDALVDAGGGGRRLGPLAAALVFVPLLITWVGLGAATWANRRMRDQDSDTEGTFLTLWQQGFDGHLWPFLRFDMMALWTVLSLAALATTTLLRQRWEQRDEQERLVLSRRLSGALAQTEALAARAAVASPRRFTEELQGAATQLHGLVAQAVGLEAGARAVVTQADGAVSRAAQALTAMESALAAVRSGASEVRVAVQGAATAAEAVARGADGISSGLSGSVTLLHDAVAEAGRAAADRIGAAGDSVAARFDAAARAAEARETTVAEQAAALLERVGADARASIDRTSASLTESSRTLTSTVRGLDGTMAALPSALETSAADGADRIGTAYDMAVTALASSLRREVRQVSDELADRITQLQVAVAARESEREKTHRGHDLAEERLRATLAEFEETLRRVTVSLREAVLAADPGAPGRSAGPPAHRPSRPTPSPRTAPAPTDDVFDERAGDAVGQGDSRVGQADGSRGGGAGDAVGQADGNRGGGAGDAVGQADGSRGGRAGDAVGQGDANRGGGAGDAVGQAEDSHGGRAGDALRQPDGSRGGRAGDAVRRADGNRSDGHTTGEPAERAALAAGTPAVPAGAEARPHGDGGGSRPAGAEQGVGTGNRETPR